MAYVLKYEAGYNSLRTTGKVSIYEDDWSGGSETLTLRSGSLKIRYALNNWEDPLIGLTASFSIVNEKEDFFELLPLVTAVEGEYWIKIERITPSILILFEGFLQCKDNEVKYLQRQDIRLNASSYLSKLEYIDPPIIEDLEDDTFINIIDGCLTQTGSTANIWVNCSLYPEGTSVSTTTTLFNKCGVYKEMFWQDNIKRDSALDTIRKILSTFDCYLFWFPGDPGIWIIDRYADIWRDTQIDYVQYTSGNAYWPSDVGTAVSNTPDVYDFADPDIAKMDTRQVIGNVVGQRQVEINIEQQLYYNMIVNNFESATYTDEHLPICGLRQWEFFEEDAPSAVSAGTEWRDLGQPFRNIARAVNRLGYTASDWPGTSDPFIPPGEGEIEWWRGMFTSFKASVSEGMILTITFKYATYDDPFLPSEADEWEVDFYWTLALNKNGTYYCFYNTTTEKYVAKSKGTPPHYEVLNRNIVSGTEFDPVNKSCEVTIQIPFDDFLGGLIFPGDYLFTFGLGTENKRHVGTPADNGPDEDRYFGDVKIVTNLPPNDNYVSGEINTKFLNKKTITQYLSDDDNLGLRNAVLYGGETTAEPDALDEKTQIWVDAHTDTSEQLSLAEIRIKDKFRLYNVNRQKITADLLNTYNWRPFQRFWDSNQGDSSADYKRFIVTESTYQPDQDVCETTMVEYDVDEQINLV